MRLVLQTLSSIAIIFLYCSCNRYVVINGSGTLREINFTDSIKGSEGAAFTSIYTDLPCDMKVIIDSAANKASISINADDNLLPYIRLRVEKKELLASFQPNLIARPSKPVAVTIKLKQLFSTKLTGAGTINIKGNNIKNSVLETSVMGTGAITAQHFITDNITANISGNGTISLDSCRANMAMFGIKGSGGIKFNGGSANTALINLTGSGTINTTDIDSVAITAIGSGTIDCAGTKKSRKQITGATKVAIH